MTGVITSNRCGTCRKRKVKCDEAEPVCAQCRQGNRVCEDPVSRLKFTKPKEPPLAEHQPNTGRQAQRILRPTQEISLVRSSNAKGGGSFQTLRVGHLRKPPSQQEDGAFEGQFILQQPPPLTPVESLQLVLLETFSCWNPGLRLSSIASYVSELPPRLGYSAALDDAIACLVNCHARICRRQLPGTDRRQGHLYAKALLSLQAALRDPSEGYSDNTLAAVTILGQVETFGGGAPDTAPQFIHHAGGAAKLIQVLGPRHFESTFAQHLYLGGCGPAIVVSLIRGEDCFLSGPEWTNVGVDACTCQAHWLMHELEQGLAALPSVVKQIRKFNLTPHEVETASILRDVQQIRRSIHGVSEYVTECLQNASDIVKVPSAYGDPLTPLVYEFSSRAIADICVFYWGVSIILDTIIARFLPPGSSRSALGPLLNRCIQYRRYICMSYVYSEQFWPLGAMYMSGPLMMAYRGATAEEKTWIMHKLWKIGEFLPHSRHFWGPGELEMASGLLFGDQYGMPSMSGSGTQVYEDAREGNMDSVEE